MQSALIFVVSFVVMLLAALAQYLMEKVNR